MANVGSNSLGCHSGKCYTGCGCGTKPHVHNHSKHHHHHYVGSHGQLVSPSGPGVPMLCSLGDVSASVGDASKLKDGQTLIYNALTGTWYNDFLDYDTIKNVPTAADFNFSSLGEVSNTKVPSGYVRWNQAGDALIYETSISAEVITGLSSVATTGDFADLVNVPVLGTVREVGITSNTLTVSPDPVTDIGALSVEMPKVIDAGVYETTAIEVDEFGRVIDVILDQNPTAKRTEFVVIRYSAGAAGNLSIADAIHSHSPGVSVEVVDAINCILRYSFTGKAGLPTSILAYGQNITTNTFRITTPATATTTVIESVITNDVPDLITGQLLSDNRITIQSRPSDTGASGILGKRAYAIIVFGF